VNFYDRNQGNKVLSPVLSRNELVKRPIATCSRRNPDQLVSLLNIGEDCDTTLKITSKPFLGLSLELNFRLQVFELKVANTLARNNHFFTESYACSFSPHWPKPSLEQK
jgi:hypothetical protein